MKLYNILLFVTLLLLPGYRISWENIIFIFFNFLASLLLDMCCHVKKVGGVKYQLVKDHAMKPAPTCKDDCVYQKIDPEGGYYCFRHGKLISECLEKDEGKMNFVFA